MDLEVISKSFEEADLFDCGNTHCIYEDEHPGKNGNHE
jgi:hypothetical protein